MSNDVALFLSKQMLWNALLIASPIILAIALCGLIIALLQAVTQIQDTTLNTAPKLLTVILMLMCCGGWMLHTMTSFARETIQHIPEALG